MVVTGRVVTGKCLLGGPDQGLPNVSVYILAVPPPLADACGQWTAALDAARDRWYVRHESVSPERLSPDVPAAIAAIVDEQSVYGTPSPVLAQTVLYSEQKAGFGSTHTPPPLADACGQWISAFSALVMARLRW